MQTMIAVGECRQPPLVAATRAEIESFPEEAGHDEDALIAAMAGSEMFQAYERSFAEAVGLPVSLTPVETWQLPHHGHRGENPFCGLLAHKSRACAVCLQTQQELTLRQVAASVGASPFYFCKLFKKSTGINFTEYVSRVQVERAKHLLLNPNLHVSEIAFEVGFQSLPHFNRMFKKILGQSPTAYRLQLLGH